MSKSQLLVYFMRPAGMDGPIKIGCSTGPEKRLKELAAWSPWPLELIGAVPGTFADEQFLHGCFAGSHSHREWFHSTAPLRDMIGKILAVRAVTPARASQVTGSIRKGRHKDWTADRRKQSSYSHRIRWALKKFRREDETEIVYAREPAEVNEIMDRWYGNPYRSRPGHPATDADIARLDAFLADPASQVTMRHIPRIRPKTGTAA